MKHYDERITFSNTVHYGLEKSAHSVRARVGVVTLTQTTPTQSLLNCIMAKELSDHHRAREPVLHYQSERLNDRIHVILNNTTNMCITA